MPDPMVREIGRVTDIDGDVTIIGVDHETVTIEPMVGQARLDASQQEDFARLFVSACSAAGYNKARMEEDARDE
jgi:hypothetical protein